MMIDRIARVLLVAGAVGLSTASVAHAQQRTEIGAGVVGVTVGFGDAGSSVTVPTGGFSMTPGFYASFFLGSRIAIEPQVSLLWFHDSGSFHAIQFGGQFDYFLRGSREPSPYLFAAVGVIETSSDYTPKSLGVGAGYRIPVGDRLTFRMDGRYAHTTGNYPGAATDVLAFSLSIGGVFGQ